MPVFQVMQPHIAEQYNLGTQGRSPFEQFGGQPGVMPPSGPVGPVQPGMGAGMAGGAQNPPMGGSPYSAGMGAVGPGGRSATEPFNPLSDATGSMVRALLASGYNPDIPSYGINKLLKRADDIVRQLAGRLALSGNENVLTGGGFQDAMNALIGGGGPVISSRAEGHAALDAINNLVKGVFGGAGAGGPGGGAGGSEGAQFLAAILGPDVGSALAFKDALEYGGLSSNVRAALKRPFASIPTRWDQMAETPQGEEIMRRRSALDLLLSGALGAGTENPWAAIPGGGGAPPAPGGLTPTLPPGLGR